jgi:hypothetical protein
MCCHLKKRAGRGWPAQGTNAHLMLVPSGRGYRTLETVGVEKTLMLAPTTE